MILSNLLARRPQSNKQAKIEHVFYPETELSVDEAS